MATRTRGNSESKMHIAIVAVAAALAVAMIGAAAWALTRPLPPGALEPAPSLPVGQGPQGTTSATSSAGATPTSTPTTGAVNSSTTGTKAPTTAGVTTPSAGRRIAFHIGDTLYISSEDGKTKTPMHITGTNYALSPDGRMVAAVEKGKFFVAKVGEHLLANSPSKPGLTAEAVAPIWMPGSSAVLFLSANPDGLARIWRYDVVDGSAADLGPGAGLAMSPDGQTMAVLPTEDAAVPVVSVAKPGTVGTTFRVPSGDPIAVTLSKSRVFVSSVSATGTSAIWSFAYDGSKKRKLAGPSLAGNTSVTYGELMVSPDGTRLLFAADGDDGYSRLWTVPTAGGTATAISGRRDGYAIGWTKDGKGILFIEGNAFQGQSTSLWVSDYKGHNRKLLVQGATL